MCTCYQRLDVHNIEFAVIKEKTVTKTVVVEDVAFNV